MKEPNTINIFDQMFLVTGEKVPGKGEDSFFCSVNTHAGIIAALDGCGGIGAKRYEAFDQHTGAYLASRGCAAGLSCWFDRYCNAKSRSFQVEDIKGAIDNELKQLGQRAAQQSMLKGKMQKEFPTTLSAVVIQGEEKCQAIFIWAGDSRGYVLDQDGLHQLTDDDVESEDEFVNLYEDGALMNLVSASAQYEIHSKQVCLELPCLVLVSTDGSFGYLRSPMEFEGMILESLYTSKNMLEWEEKIKQAIEAVTGDDYTLGCMVLGYQSFGQLKKLMAPRTKKIRREYLPSDKDREQLEALWKTYQMNYKEYRKND